MEIGKKSYSAEGLVLGNYWGGGSGSYPARELYDTTVEGLRSQIEDGLKTGSLDSGMGYVKLIGALMRIIVTTTVFIEGKEFTNEDWELEYFGELTEEQIDFLTTEFYYS